MPTGNILRTRSVFTGLPGGPAITSMYFSVGGGGGQAAADATRAFWSGCATLVNAGSQVQVQDEVVTINSATGEIVASTPTTTPVLAFTGSGDSLSLGTQGLLNLNTGAYLGGRQVRGKVYVPNPTETNNSGGRPLSSYRNAIESAWGLLLAVAGTAPVVYSPTHGQYFQVSSVTPSTYWARLRSRQR